MLVQLQILNLVLSRCDMSIITKNGLTVDHFPKFRNEFNYIYNHFKKYGQTPDLTTFIKSFPNFEVLKVNESIDYLLSELNREKTENFLANTFNKVRDLLMKGDTEGALSMYTSSVQNAHSSMHLEAVDILSDISRYDEYADKCNNFMHYYVSTGFKELDSIIGGWDRKEEYATISARSGVGKTWVLLKSITAAVERGLRVGLYSGEMSVNKIGYRFDTLMSHLSNGKIMHGNSDVSLNYKKYLENLKDNHKGSLYVLTRDRIDGKATVDVLRGFVEKYELDILFVDQHSLLDSSGNERNSFEKAASISKDLKVLQVTKHIPIITVSQQNRSSIEDGKFAGTENIANSDRIAQDSTVIIFVSQKDGVMTLHIGKSRDGGTGKSLNYLVDLDKGRFEYIQSEEDDQPSQSSSDEDFSIAPRSYEVDTIDSDELPFTNM